jgi:hypothetical protein
MSLGLGFALPAWQGRVGGIAPIAPGQPYIVKSSGGTSYIVTTTPVLASDGTPYTVVNPVLGSDGTSYLPI